MRKLIIYKTQVQLAVNSMQYLLDVNSQMTNSLVRYFGRVTCRRRY